MHSTPIVVDTSVFLLVFQKKLNFEDEVERLIESPHFFAVLAQCVDELTEMSRKQRRYSPASRAALRFIQDKPFFVDKRFPGKPDNAMLEYCKTHGGVLATLDAELRRKAKKLGIRTIFLREKGHWAIT